MFPPLLLSQQRRRRRARFSCILAIVGVCVIVVSLQSFSIILFKTTSTTSSVLVSRSRGSVSDCWEGHLHNTKAVTTATTTVTYQNDASSSLSSPVSLFFVHIGKTGGETIKWRLKLSCELRKSRRKKETCRSMFYHQNKQESELSQRTIGYYHCGKIQPTPQQQQQEGEETISVMERATTFLVSVRDPINRIVSWYQYMHPQNCLPHHPSAACNLKKEKQLWWGQLFYHQCFPTLQDWINAIVVVVTQKRQHHDKIIIHRNDNTTTTTTCWQLAVDTVQGRGPEGPTNHMYFNYAKTFQQTMAKTYPNQKEIMVVRQESLWDDLLRIEGLLGGNTDHDFLRQGPIVTHGSEKFPYQATLQNEHDIPILCCVILEEIQVYIYLLQRATNLNADQKEQSIQHLLTRCSISNSTSTRNPSTPKSDPSLLLLRSIYDLRNQCQQSIDSKYIIMTHNDNC